MRIIFTKGDLTVEVDNWDMPLPLVGNKVNLPDYNGVLGASGFVAMVNWNLIIKKARVDTTVHIVLK